MKKSRILACSIVSLLSAASSYAAAITWTTGGDASGTWSSATFNGTAYSAGDDLSIDGTATKTITISSPTTPNSLTVSGTGTTGATITGNAGVPGTGAITLTGTSVGGTLSKTGTADLVLATPNAFGAVSISNGKFFLNDQNGLGTTGTLTVNSGAASGVSGSYAAGTMGQFFYDSSNIDADTTFSKNIAFGTVASATIYGMVMRTNTTTPHTTTLSGNITGASNITLRLDGSVSGDGVSTWSLTGNNSGFSGSVYLNRGRLFLGNANAAGTGTITLATNPNVAGNLVMNFAGTLTNAIIVGTGGDVISPGANSVTLSGVVSNSTGWVKAGTGTLTLTNANNTLTSTITVSDGTLLVGGAGRLNTATYAGAVTLTASTSALEYASSAGNNLSGVISGLGSFRKTGSADITLYGNSTYSGGTTLTAGILRVATSNTALGTGPITVTSGTVNTSASPTLGTSNVGTGGARTLANNIAITNNGTGTTTLTADGGYYPLTLNGAISGNGKLVTTSTGTVTLGGANTYTGTTTATASGSILQFAKEVSLYNNNTAGTGWTAANIIVNTGATLGFNVGGTGEFTAADLDILQGLTNVASGTTATAGFKNGSILGLDTTNAAGGTFTYGSAIANHVAGATTDTLGVTKLGTGTLALSGANTYSGGTALSSGYLQFNNAGAIPATGTITVNTNGSLVAAGVYSTVQGWLGDSHLATASTGAIAITGNSSEAINFTGFNTLGLSATGTATYSGTITPGTGGYFFGGDTASNLTVASTLTGGNALTKYGPSTLTLTAANNYSGTTTVTAGTLALTGSGSINGGAVTVSGGAVSLAGASAITGTSVTVSGGTLSLTGTGALNGTSVTVSGGTLSLAGGSTLNATNGGTVTIGAGSLSTYSVNAIGAAGSTINLTNGTTGLVYTGAGETTDRVISYNSAASGGTITANGSGLLTFSNPASTTATAAVGITLNGSGTGSFVGVTQPATPVLINLNKQGSSTWTLTGLNNLNAGAFSVAGGVLNFASTATTGSAASAATVSRSATGGGILTIASGASVITSTVNTNSILGGWATFAGNTWAVTNGNAAAITGLASGSYTANTWTANTTNVDVTSSNTSSALLANSLRFNTAGALTQTLSGVNLLTSGGILVTSAVGANTTTITGGTSLSSGALNASSDLIIHQNNSAGALTIASVIVNNGTGTTSLTKAGAGLLSLTATNTYTGATNISGGTLSIGGTGRLATGSYAGAITLATGAVLDDSSTAAQTLSGAISGGGAITKSGASTLTLSGSNTYSGTTTVSVGTLQFSAPASFYGSTAGAVSSANAALLTVQNGATAIFNVGGASDFTAADIATLATSNGTTGFLAGSTIGIDTTNATSGATYSGNLTNTNGGALSLAVTKLGTNALTLSGTNTYSGGTTVGGGTLVLTGTNSSSGQTTNSAGGTLRVKTGALASGTLNFGGGILTGLTDGSATTIPNSVFFSVAAGTLIFGDASATGALTFTGSTSTGTAASNRTLNTFVNTTFSNTLTGTNGNLIKTGAAKLTLSNVASTTSLSATGGFIVTGGTLEVTRLASATANSSIGKTTVASTVPSITLDGGTLAYIAGGAAASSTDRLLQIGQTTAGATGTIQNNDPSAAENITFSNTGAIAYGTTGQTRSLILGGTNTGANTLASAINDNGTGGTVSVTKQDAGTWVLSGSNSYTGPTNVTAGTLLLSGSIGGTTTVSSGATLGGRRDLNVAANDNITGAVTINAGGTLLIGDGNSVGAGSTDGLSINGPLTLADNSQITLSLGVSGSHTTLLDEGSPWTFSSTQMFSILNFGAQVGVTYNNIIEGLTSNPGVSAWTLTGGYTGNFTYNSSNGVDLVLTAVPEPSTAVSLLGGMALLLGWHRRQRVRGR